MEAVCLSDVSGQKRKTTTTFVWANLYFFLLTSNHHTKEMYVYPQYGQSSVDT